MITGTHRIYSEFSKTLITDFCSLVQTGKEQSSGFQNGDERSLPYRIVDEGRDSGISGYRQQDSIG